MIARAEVEAGGEVAREAAAVADDIDDQRGGGAVFLRLVHRVLQLLGPLLFTEPDLLIDVYFV